MKKLFYLLLCCACIVSLLPVGPSTAVSNAPPQHQPTQVPRPQTLGASPGGIRRDAFQTTSLPSEPPSPGRLPILRSAARLSYSSHVYTHSDLLIFSYQDNTQFQVTNSVGTSIWSGILNNGQHMPLSPGKGVYLVAGSRPFSVAVGDQLTDYVWGYYAIDQYGHGLSTLLYTYQAQWYDPTYDPHFIVFAYENSTHVTVQDSTTGLTIWSGTLNAGQHYDSTTINGQYLTVRADRPVSALSYTDQGYFVPSNNGSFVGNIFHTFLGNSGGWDEYLNLIAYENTGVTVKDSNTGALIWSGTLVADQAYTVLGLNSRFVTVESSNRIAVSVHPAPYYTPGGYYHSIYAQDSTGTGIGTHFVLPAISGAWLVFFAYDDGCHITIRDAAGTTVYDGTLNRGEWNYIVTSATVYTILSTGQISAILDWGDKAGADFAPVHYAALQVDVVTPNGDTYRHGDVMRVVAHVTQLAQNVLGAKATGRIQVTGPGDTMSFELNDNGLYGDQTPDDALYSAEVPLPDVATLPDGNYFVYITANKTEPNNSTTSGTGVSTFSLAGSLQRAPTVNVRVGGPSPAAVYVGDTIKITATAFYEDNVNRPSTTVIARITRPGLIQVDLPLTYQSANTWVGNYTCDLGGRYLLDIRAAAPTGTTYATGYGSAVLEVLASNSPVALTLDPLASPYARGDTAWLKVTVYAGGTRTDRANVFAEISPGDTVLPLKNNGNGQYIAAYYADTPGTFNATIYASVPFFIGNQAQTSFLVSNASKAFASQVTRFGEGANADMDNLQKTALEVAQDGDWFNDQVIGDLFSTAFDLVSGIIDLHEETGQVLKSISTDGLIRGYTPGLDDFKLIKSQTGIDGRAFESWASRMTHAVRESVLDPSYSGRVFPKWVGPNVFKRALVAYGAKYAHMTMEEFEEEIIVRGGTFVAEKTAGAFTALRLQDGIYAYLNEDVNEYKQVITDYTTATLTDMPALTPTQEDAYSLDLSRRQRADIYTTSNAYHRNAILFWARDARDDQGGLLKSLIQMLLHQALRILVGVLADGPGVLVVDVVWTGMELYQDVKNLEQDVQMWNWATNSLVRIYEEQSNLYMNAISGLVQVRHGATPHTPSGEMVTIRSVSRRTNCWTVFCEQEVVAQITIRNTGAESARFKPEACYYGTRKFGMEVFSHCIEGFRQSDGSHDMWMSIPPSGQQTVEILFKDDQGHDVCPPDGTMINYVLYANNNTGTFYVDSDSQALQPTSEMRQGLFMASQPDLAGASLSASASVIPHPIYLAAMPSADGIEQPLHLEAVNGLGFPVNATIVQTIPNGVYVASPGGGRVEGNRITWRTVLQPHDSSGIDFAVALPGLPSETVVMPPTELSFYLAQEDGTLYFYSAPLTLTRRLPLRAQAVLPGTLAETVSVPVNVTNWSQETESASLTLILYNQQATPLLSSVQAVQLCPGCSQPYTLTLHPNVPKGVYALEVTITTRGYTETVETALVSYQPQRHVYLPVVSRDYQTTQNLIRNGDFEAGLPPTPWIEHSAGGYAVVYANAGYNSSWGGWLGGYDNAWDYLEQPFVVPGGATGATLSLYWGLTSADSTTTVYDRLTVTLRDSSGNLLRTLLTKSNTDPRDLWYYQTVPIDLSPYAGQSLRLRLEAQTDASLVTNFFVDNIELKLGSPTSPSMASRTGSMLPPKRHR